MCVWDQYCQINPWYASNIMPCTAYTEFNISGEIELPRPFFMASLPTSLYKKTLLALSLSNSINYRPLKYKLNKK